jgi:hypothetical protein
MNVICILFIALNMYNIKFTKTLFFGGGGMRLIIRRYSVLAAVLLPNPREKRVMGVNVRKKFGLV